MPNRNNLLAGETEPIVVNGMVLPTMLAVVLRQCILLVLPVLVAKGIIPEGSTEGVVTYALVIATVLYGLWKSYRTKKDLVVTAEAAPNDIAVVK